MSSQPNDFDAVLPPAARQRIEEKVEAYVETWKRYRTATASDRQRPDPSVFLEDSTSGERLVLLRRLCEVDILCRREMGEQPRAEDYDRYPEVAAALLHLFEESELNGGAPNRQFVTLRRQARASRRSGRIRNFRFLTLPPRKS